MSQFSLFMLLGVALLFIVVVVAQGGLPQVCDTGVRLCPDGSFVQRDFMNNCEFYDCPSSNLIGFCINGVVSVQGFDEFIKVLNEDGNYTVYDGNTTDCPVLPPADTSPACRDFDDLEWALLINCSLVTTPSFYCPTDYEVIEGFKWINCDEPVPEKFKSYCEDWFMKWIRHNCPDINFV